jgi:large subunit ribosomal protein L29
MGSMPESNITDLSDTELVEEHSEAKRELFNLRFQLATGQLDNTARIKAVKRRVARIRTELRAREIAAAEAATAGVEA